MRLHVQLEQKRHLNHAQRYILQPRALTLSRGYRARHRRRTDPGRYLEAGQGQGHQVLP